MHSAYFEQYIDTVPPRPRSEQEIAAYERLMRTSQELQNLLHNLRGTSAAIATTPDARLSTLVRNTYGDLHCNHHAGYSQGSANGLMCRDSMTKLGGFNYFRVFTSLPDSIVAPLFYSAEVIGEDGNPLVTIDVER